MDNTCTRITRLLRIEIIHAAEGHNTEWAPQQIMEHRKGSIDEIRDPIKKEESYNIIVLYVRNLQK